MRQQDIVSIRHFEAAFAQVFCAGPEAKSAKYLDGSGASVYWNSWLKCWESPAPDQGFLEAFERILLTVESELGVLLTLRLGTEYSGFSDEAIEGIMLTFFDFQVAKFPPFPLVYVESDGSVRELTIGERLYLKTDFHPADGARPSIKSRYEDKNGLGSMAGFCFRERLPSAAIVKPRPSSPAPTIREELARAHGMGYEIEYGELEYVEALWRPN